MAKEARSAQAPATYGEVVQRLQAVVEALEGGELSLEDSLQRFEEGVGLVKRGENLLAEAEKRIEQLLADDRAAPVELSPGTSAPAKPGPTKGAVSRAERLPSPSLPPERGSDDDDVPF